MHRIYSALIDIVAAAIFIVPLLALYGKISLRSLKHRCTRGTNEIK